LCVNSVIYKENSLVLAAIRTPVGQAGSRVTVPTTLYRVMNAEDADIHLRP